MFYPYFGLWMGKAAIFARLFMLFLVALMLILQLYHATHFHRSILAGAIALFVLNLCWQIRVAFIPILPSAHFGVPFLNPGQFSLATSLLLLFAAITPRERPEAAASSFTIPPLCASTPYDAVQREVLQAALPSSF